MFGVFVASCLFFVGAWSYPFVFGRQCVVLPAIHREGADASVRSKNDGLPLESYTGALDKKDLFGLLFVEETVTPGRSEAAEDVLKTLVLLGVVSGSDQQAVIEDTSRQKTYFLREGEKVNDEVMVERIAQGKVFLRVAGRTYEINL